MHVFSDFLKRPADLPEFTQGPAVWVPHSNTSTKAFAVLPYAPGSRNKRALRSAISDRYGLTGNRSLGGIAYAKPYFVFAKKGNGCDYVAAVVDALREDFGSVEVIRDYSRQGFCTEQCQEATGQDCECICRGRGHGGGRIAKHEKRVPESLIIGTDYQRVRRVYGG